MSAHTTSVEEHHDLAPAAHNSRLGSARAAAERRRKERRAALQANARAWGLALMLLLGAFAGAVLGVALGG